MGCQPGEQEDNGLSLRGAVATNHGLGTPLVVVGVVVVVVVVRCIVIPVILSSSLREVHLVQYSQGSALRLQYVTPVSAPGDRSRRTFSAPRQDC